MKEYTIDKDFLLLYETPTLGQYIWFDWGSSLMSNYLVWKINRKIRRLEKLAKLLSYKR